MERPTNTRSLSRMNRGCIHIKSINCRINASQSIVVGGRDFDIAGGPPNVHIVGDIHRVYQWYIRYVYSIYGGPPAKTKSQKWRPPTTMSQSITCSFETKITACRHLRSSASVFKIKLNLFLDTLSQKIFFQIMKVNNFRGDLTSASFFKIK